jgi:hypothetical protein
MQRIPALRSCESKKLSRIVVLGATFSMQQLRASAQPRTLCASRLPSRSQSRHARIVVQASSAEALGSAAAGYKTRPGVRQVEPQTETGGSGGGGRGIVKPPPAGDGGKEGASNWDDFMERINVPKRCGPLSCLHLVLVLLRRHLLCKKSYFLCHALLKRPKLLFLFPSQWLKPGKANVSMGANRA